MNLKDIMAADVDNVFFNEDEFATPAIIDGREVLVMFDQDYMNGKTETGAMGLAEGEQLIFVKGKDLRRLPQPDEQITIDGKQWYIKHSLSNLGVFELRIGRERVYA